MMLSGFIVRVREEIPLNEDNGYPLAEGAFSITGNHFNFESDGRTFAIVPTLSPESRLYKFINETILEDIKDAIYFHQSLKQ